jgi:hexulose-6-phosphate isomerase
MQKSISYWCFPGGTDGTKSLSEAMREALDARYEAIEPAIGPDGPLTPDTTRGQAESIRAEADRLGIGIASVASGLYWGRNMGAPDPQVREAATEELARMLRITSWLGADALLTIPATVDVFFNPDAPVVPYDTALENARVGLQRVLPVAEEVGVSLAIENVWNKLFLSPVELRDFIDSFDSTRVASYFDVGNVVLFGYPEQWIRILGHRIQRVHLKDFKRAVGTADGFCDLLEGDVNWPAVMGALEEVGYDGPLTSEVMPGYANYPHVRIENTSRAMDAIMGR